MTQMAANMDPSVMVPRSCEGFFCRRIFGCCVCLNKKMGKNLEDGRKNRENNGTHFFCGIYTFGFIFFCEVCLFLTLYAYGFHLHHFW